MLLEPPKNIVIISSVDTRSSVLGGAALDLFFQLVRTSYFENVLLKPNQPLFCVLFLYIVPVPFFPFCCVCVCASDRRGRFLEGLQPRE